MTSAQVSVIDMIWDNILVLVTLIGLGGSAGVATEPTRTVAPWYREMQNRAEGVSDVPEGGEFSFSIRMAHVSQCK